MGPHVAHDIEGSGSPVVLLHAYGMWGDWWKACGYSVALADRGHQAVILDVPGHGSSTKSHDPSDYAMERVVAGVLEVLDDAGIGSFIVWGHGTGGTIAQALALTGRVTQAVVGACALGLPEEIYDLWAQPLREEVSAGDWSSLRERLGTSPEGLPDLEEVNDPAALAAFLTGNPWGTTPESLFDLGIPLIAYQGEEDPAVGFGPVQAEPAGASFFTVPGDIRASFVDSGPVLDGVLTRLE